MTIVGIGCPAAADAELAGAGGAGCTAGNTVGLAICPSAIAKPPKPINSPIMLLTIHLCMSARKASISAFVANVGRIASWRA